MKKATRDGMAFSGERKRESTGKVSHSNNNRNTSLLPGDVSALLYGPFALPQRSGNQRELFTAAELRRDRK